MVIDGKKIAGQIIAELKKQLAPQKELAAILVGENPASASFLRQKEKIAKDLGVNFQLHNLRADLSQGELIVELGKLISSDQVGGFILQLPLPEKYDRDEVLAALPSEKDVDALTGRGKAVPPAVLAVQDVLKEVRFSLADKVVGVVGRGLLVGRPIAEWLSGQCREVIIFHTKTDLSRIADCDLVISGAGKAGLIKPDMLKPGAGLIDFGFDMVDGKVRGDFDPASLVVSRSSVSFYTPTPGGTGPILVAELFKNFYTLN
ncbi:MAG: methylenetetrahydrofolate dehydrogenase (NADP+) / methenyltetrahydrofolate cyclohydrolase [Parcubacteria group bacterium Gr01-1014_19]|nr:MAG: methylenetetrahydrofolate dehydrogenase (NADP+) / methenyltetrahydrofolate cyclohydrolase [Parcubacteria group bacterium Gr01-1014_19]